MGKTVTRAGLKAGRTGPLPRAANVRGHNFQYNFYGFVFVWANFYPRLTPSNRGSDATACMGAKENASPISEHEETRLHAISENEETGSLHNWNLECIALCLWRVDLKWKAWSFSSECMFCWSPWNEISIQSIYFGLELANAFLILKCFNFLIISYFCEHIHQNYPMVLRLLPWLPSLC